MTCYINSSRQGFYYYFVWWIETPVWGKRCNMSFLQWHTFLHRDQRFVVSFWLSCRYETPSPAFVLFVLLYFCPLLSQIIAIIGKWLRALMIWEQRRRKDGCVAWVSHPVYVTTQPNSLKADSPCIETSSESDPHPIELLLTFKTYVIWEWPRKSSRQVSSDEMKSKC